MRICIPKCIGLSNRPAKGCNYQTNLHRLPCSFQLFKSVTRVNAFTSWCKSSKFTVAIEWSDYTIRIVIQTFWFSFVATINTTTQCRLNHYSRKRLSRSRNWRKPWAFYRLHSSSNRNSLLQATQFLSNMNHWLFKFNAQVTSKWFINISV